MKVYSVSPVESVDGGVAYFTDKATAFRSARVIARGGTEATVEVETVREGGGRGLVVALLNRVGWSIGSEVVKVFPAKDCPAPEDGVTKSAFRCRACGELGSDNYPDDATVRCRNVDCRRHGKAV